jgi:hypothetical protein
MTSKIRVICAIPSSTQLNFFVDNKLKLDAISYKDVSNYFAVTPGMHTVEVRAYDTTKKADFVFTDLSVTFATKPDVFYTIVVAGIKQPKELLIFTNDNKCAPDGSAKIHVIHAADAGPIDVLAGDLVVAKDVEYGNSAKFGDTYSLVVPVGNVNISVNLAGTTNRVIGPLSLPLLSGGVYTIFAVGIPGDPQYPLAAIRALDKPLCVY